jgi:vanillin dehydrogenase
VFADRKADILNAETGALSGNLFINGEWVASSHGEVVDVENPATGEVFATAQQASVDDVNAAIEAAEIAFKKWSKTAPGDREQILMKAADIFERRRDDVFDLLCTEAGSTFAKTNFEIQYVAEMLRGAAGECRRIFGNTMPSDTPGLLSFSFRKPLGVIATIAPFNFPMLLSMKKMAFALAAGNTVVLKPADETPLCGLFLAEILQEAGVPAGVVNVVPGSATAFGEIVTSDPRVKYLTFTGSTRVGRLLATKAARNLKKYTLELGGKNPLIVFEDADIEYAVNTAAFGVFIHQGQICMASSRILVQRNIFDEFAKRLVAKAETLKIGDPRDKNTIIGPLIRRSQIDVIQDHIQDALDKGATLLTGGTSEGNFFAPTILTNVTSEMNVSDEESFGPLTHLMPFDKDDEAIRLANETAYGLSAAVLTNDLIRAHRMVDEIDAGMVHVNGPTVFDEPLAPFGGTKMSGTGREGGQYSIDEMTELKWMTIRQEQREYPF